MLALAGYGALTLALTAALWRLLEPWDRPRPAVARACTAALLLLLAAQTLAWCWAVRAPSPFELSLPPSPAEAAGRVALCAATALAAFASISPALALEGLVAGLLLALLGAQGAGWLRLFEAWRLLGWFSGTFFAPLIPAFLAACAALAVFALRGRELEGRRWQTCLALLLLWALPLRACSGWIRSRYAIRAPSLAADAGLPPAAAAERVSLAWLYPWAGRTARFEEKQAAASGVNVDPESLEKLDAYVRARDLKGVFVRQAVAALRQGWLFWWEPDRALDAASLGRPGRLIPDYVAALDLVRAGPMDEPRYRRLQKLSEAAAPRTEGFDDVNRSQLIFEGFASAFARFGDEESQRPWLFRIDNLWPIYDKKIEITPVETRHDGHIEGTVFIDGAPAEGVKVGLFYVALSTAASPLSGWLSESDFPDARGRFSFDALAPGYYYLGLMGVRSQLRGRVLNSPGLVQLTSEKASLVLDPIRVQR